MPELRFTGSGLQALDLAFLWQFKRLIETVGANYPTKEVATVEANCRAEDGLGFGRAKRRNYCAAGWLERRLRLAFNRAMAASCLAK
jgi:hypothetical protein